MPNYLNSPNYRIAHGLMEVALAVAALGGCKSPAPAAPSAPPAVAPEAPVGLAAEATAPAGLPSAVSAVAAVPALEPAAAYQKYCSLCHGPAREGYAADNAPSLKSATFLQSASPNFLRDSIARGRPGTAMAAYGREFGGPLTAADVDAMVTWLRQDAPALLPMDASLAVGDPGQGLALFGAKCTECHGAPTQRATAVHLFNQVFLALASDSFLRHAIVYGRPGTDMEAWADELTPEQTNHVIAYMRSLAVAGAAEPPPPVGPPAEPWVESPVLNPTGKHAEFQLKDDRLVTPEAVHQALTQKRRIVIADARTPSDWSRIRIPGSVSLPYYDLRNLEKIPNDGTWVIAYCACPHHASGVVVDELRKRGYKHTAVMDEGIFSYQHKGFEVVAAEGGVPTAAPPAYDQPHMHPGLHPAHPAPPMPAPVPPPVPPPVPAPKPSK